MARGFPRWRLTPVLLAALLVLTSCVRAPETGAPATRAADPELTRLATAMQRTVLEGAVAGGVVGGGIGFTVGGGNRDDIRTGVSFGALAGATAGTYVAYMRQTYALRSRRLREIRADLDENAREVATTIAVMRRVLAVQSAELDALRQRAASGAPARELVEELAEARANLVQMQRAVAGAEGRRSEFQGARTLVQLDTRGSEIDPELAELSAQIAQMRAIAGELAGRL